MLDPCCRPAAALTLSLFLALVVPACAADAPSGTAGVGGGSGGSGGDSGGGSGGVAPGGSGGLEPGGSGGGGAGGTGGGEGGTGGETTLPRLDALEPDHGVAGTAVDLVGANLANETSRLRVFFGGIESVALSVDAAGSRIRTAVPAGARSGLVYVLTDEVRVEGPTFTVDPNPAPHLTSLDPASIPAGQAATVRLLGTGLFAESRVLVDGAQVTSSYVSGTELQIAASGLAAGTHAVQVITDPPGGGESEILSLDVYEQMNLIRATAPTATAVDLTFDTAVNATQAADPTLYAINPALAVTAAAVDAADPAVVHLVTETQVGGTLYRLQVSPTLSSATGGALRNGNAQFRGFRLLPVETGAIGGTGCDSTTLSGPSGITFGQQTTYITERTGHQIQTYRQGQLRAFLGYDGTASGTFQTGHTAAGCPTDTGSSLDGAFSGPMGKYVTDQTTSEKLFGDTGNDRIVRWSQAGAYVGVFGTGFTGPVILGLFDGSIWVAGSDDSLRRVAFDGTESPALGGTGQGPGQFRFGVAQHVAPAAALASDGSLLVTDALNHRLQRLVAGVPTGQFGGGQTDLAGAGAPPATCCDAGAAAGFLTRPRGVAVDSSGVIWVVDEANGGRLLRIETDGTPGGEVPLAYTPSFVGVDGFGRIWIGDETADLVHVLQ